MACHVWIKNINKINLMPLWQTSITLRDTFSWPSYSMSERGKYQGQSLETKPKMVYNWGIKLLPVKEVTSQSSGWWRRYRYIFEHLLTLNSVILFHPSDPHGVINMNLPLKTVQCLQLAWGNSRSKPITPSTSTETCEYQPSNLTGSF